MAVGETARVRLNTVNFDAQNVVNRSFAAGLPPIRFHDPRVSSTRRAHSGSGYRPLAAGAAAFTSTEIHSTHCLSARRVYREPRDGEILPDDDQLTGMADVIISIFG